MGIIHGQHGVLSIGEHTVVPVQSWEATVEQDALDIGPLLPLRRFTLRGHVSMTRRQLIQFLRLCGARTSLHRREKRRQRKRHRR